MKMSIFFSKYDETIKENSLLSFIVIILTIGFIGSSFFSYKAIKNQKVILLTPNMPTDSRLETEGNELNFEFIRLYSEYISSLLLNYTPHTYERKIKDFLFICTPTYASHIKQDLYKNLENVKKTGAISIYHLTDKIQMDKKNKQIFIYGERVILISGKIVDSKQENYVIQYRITNRRFFVNGFKKNN